MGYLPSLFLAVLQGVTEFLPVSSSGHLALAQMFLPGFRPDVVFDILLHVATLVAVLAYFRRDVMRLLVGAVSPARAGAGDSPFAGAERRTVLLILVATVATGVVGLALKGPAERAFHTPAAVGAALLVTAALLVFSGLPRGEGRSMPAFSWWQAALVGLAQGLAVFPGVSRSGATIAVCLLLGMDRRSAAPFSLLLSIPAILGAFVLKIDEFQASGHGWGPALLSFPVAAVVGLLCIHLLVRSVEGRWFRHFAWYCAVLGLLVLLLPLFL